jgi:hypothetical protein
MKKNQLDMEFNKINWRLAYKWLETKQEELIKAYEKKIWNKLLRFKYPF